MLATFLFNFENYFCDETPAIEYVTKKLINQEIDRKFNKTNSGHTCTWWTDWLGPLEDIPLFNYCN